MIAISSKAHDHISRAILISGSARSGTTILGKVVHSFEGVEYAYEPPVLYGLFPLIHELSREQWSMLYEVHLYEEHFMGAIAGRSINCNLSDDSSIYRVKSESDIKSRLATSISKEQAEEQARLKIIAYKMPDIVAYIPKLQEYYPDTRVVVINRKALATINSLYKKKWFTNENANKNLLWPFSIYKDIQIPFWVKVEDHQNWYEMDSVDRCAYYYLQIMTNVPKITNKIELNYEDLVKSPDKVIEDLAGTLGLKWGAKTKEIISTIAPTDSTPDKNIFDRVSKTLRDQITMLET